MQQYFQISKSLQGLQRFAGFNGLLYLCIENLWGCAVVAREFHMLYTLGPVRGRFLLGNETEAINYNKILISANISILTIIN